LIQEILETNKQLGQTHSWLEEEGQAREAVLSKLQTLDNARRQDIQRKRASERPIRLVFAEAMLKQLKDSGDLVKLCADHEAVKALIHKQMGEKSVAAAFGLICSESSEKYAIDNVLNTKIKNQQELTRAIAEDQQMQKGPGTHACGEV
jgi:hypothetical protein